MLDLESFLQLLAFLLASPGSIPSKMRKQCSTASVPTAFLILPNFCNSGDKVQKHDKCFLG